MYHPTPPHSCPQSVKWSTHSTFYDSNHMLVRPSKIKKDSRVFLFFFKIINPKLLNSHRQLLTIMVINMKTKRRNISKVLRLFALLIHSHGSRPPCLYCLEFVLIHCSLTHPHPLPRNHLHTFFTDTAFPHADG